MWWSWAAVIGAVAVVALVVWRWRWLASLGVRFGRWLVKHSRLLRRLAAACFFMAALTLTLLSSFTPYLQTCADQIARVGTVPTVRTCDPMSIDTPSILILVIAAGVCLLPEWNAFEIPGILRVEKKVEEQGRRQEEMFRLLQQINVSQHQNTTVAIIRSIDELNERYEVFTSVPTPPEGDTQ